MQGPLGSSVRSSCASVRRVHAQSACAPVGGFDGVQGGVDGGDNDHGRVWAALLDATLHRDQVALRVGQDVDVAWRGKCFSRSILEALARGRRCERAQERLVRHRPEDILMSTMITVRSVLVHMASSKSRRR